MNISKLSSDDRSEVRRYVEEKFKKFNTWYYPKKSRKNKALEYWVASSGTPHGQQAVVDLYSVVFHTAFPISEATLLERRLSESPTKVESSAWLNHKQGHLVRLERTLAELKKWEDEQEYQMGEEFLARLRTRTQFIDDSLCDAHHFATDFSAVCKAAATGSSRWEERNASAEFDALVGFKQAVSVEFESFDPNWGEINAKLEQSFKSGAWANGTAEAQFNKLGIRSDVEGAIAIGGKLGLDGQLAWKKRKTGMRLEGSAAGFVGASTYLRHRLSARAHDGLQASLFASAFAGFKASVFGKCQFTYEGMDIFREEAFASVSFGAGASISASIKTSVFGPTEISFGGSLTVGLGGGFSTLTVIDFSQAALAANAQFHTLMYCRTLAQGYRMDLINSDARNLHYLKKAISRAESEIESTKETIASFQKLPKDKRPLLMTYGSEG
jgi:hypothetical protein